MLCENNLFCASLESGTRDELCRHCSKRRLTSGSMLLSEDFSLKTNLLITGAMVTGTDFSSDVIREPYDVPTFSLLTSGLLFPIDTVFLPHIPDQFSYSMLMCLTDCAIARFDHDVIRDMFNSDSFFAQCVLLNSITSASHEAMFAATLRSHNVYQSVKWLLHFLSDKGVTLTHQQIADVTTHNRTSVTKAISAIKQREPELWLRYQRADEPQRVLYSPSKSMPSGSKLPLLKKVLNYLADIGIQTLPERCIRVRNRTVECVACASACPGGAISIENFNVTVQSDRCLLCGACVAACPFDVFSASNPNAADLVEEVDTSSELTDGNPIVVCGHTQTDLVGTYAPHVVRVNCLGRLDEDFYASVAELGLESITLVHGKCRECPRSTSGAQARRCFQSAQAALFAWEVELTMRFTDKMPTEAFTLAHASKPSKAPLDQRGRKRALQSFDHQTPPVSGDSRERTEEERTRSIISKIRLKDGALPYHPSPWPGRVYEKLCMLGDKPDEIPAMRFWGIPAIDVAHCKQCGMCAVFCEAGAIKKVEQLNYRKKKTLFAFEVEPFLCARCGCCEQVCENKAIRIKPLEHDEDTAERQALVVFEADER